MADGDVFMGRFPITVDIDGPQDTTPQVGLVTPALFTDTQFPVLDAIILPVTGGNGKTRIVVLVTGRAVS